MTGGCSRLYLISFQYSYTVFCKADKANKPAHFSMLIFVLASVKLFHATDLFLYVTDIFLYVFKTSENLLWFSDVFRGYSNKAVAWNRLMCLTNSLSDKPTKWQNRSKQFVSNLPTKCLSVFDHFVGMALNVNQGSTNGVHCVRAYTYFY